MKKINPKIIHATISGFGKEGPNAGDMGFDVVCYYGRSGLLTDSAPKGNTIIPPYGGGDVNSGIRMCVEVANDLKEDTPCDSDSRGVFSYQRYNYCVHSA